MEKREFLSRGLRIEVVLTVEEVSVHRKQRTHSSCCSIFSDRLQLSYRKMILWGCSSAGRAPALQAGGHGFDSHHLHQRQVAASKYRSRTVKRGCSSCDDGVRILSVMLRRPVKPAIREAGRIKLSFGVGLMFIENRIKSKKEKKRTERGQI